MKSNKTRWRYFMPFSYQRYLCLLLGRDISIYWCLFFCVVSINALYNVYLLLGIWYVMYFYTYTHIWTSERPTAHIAGPSRYLNGLVWESGAGKPVCSSYEHIAPCLANCFLKTGSADGMFLKGNDQLLSLGGSDPQPSPYL